VQRALVFQKALIWRGHGMLKDCGLADMGWDGRLSIEAAPVKAAAPPRTPAKVLLVMSNSLTGSREADCGKKQRQKSYGPELGISGPALREWRWEGTHRQGCCLCWFKISNFRSLCPLLFVNIFLARSSD
jgi:hypothetical protein